MRSRKGAAPLVLSDITTFEQVDSLQFLSLKVRYKICSKMPENFESNQVFTAK